MMATSLSRLEYEASPPGRFLFWSLGLFVAAHAAIFLMLPGLETRFQLGDRAWDRSMKLDALMSQTSLDGVLAILFRYDAPGDYIFFFPAYALFGTPGVIAQNLVLYMIGAWYLYRIAETWFTPFVARMATVVWLLLPATLFHPHTLVSEAICDPLLIAATFHAGCMLTRRAPVTGDAVKFGLVMAILCFVRPFYVLLPLMVSALALMRGDGLRMKLKAAGIACALSVSLVVLWQAALTLNGGRYPVEPSFHGLASNLYLRAERGEALGGYRLPEDVRQARLLPPADFVKLALEHPLDLGRTYLSDAVNIAGNTGVNMVYGRFFGLFDLKEASDADVFKWRDVRDSEGLGPMLRMLWETSPKAVTYNLAAICIWALMLVLAAWGLMVLASNVSYPARFRILLVLVPAYAIVFCFASGSVRWDHRSPAEFAICLLLAIGIAALTGRHTHSRRTFAE
ncbi:MAG: hypothetical protein AB7U38_12500 [Hyphomicrobiales bacterium]